MKSPLLALAATLFTAGAVPAALAPAAQAATAMSAVTYARMAGSSDLYEKESSEAVLAGAQNADVKRFAEMMVSDHANTTAQLLAAARQSGVSAAPKLLSKHAQMLKQLRKVGTPAREKTYMRQQVAAHQEALALHQNYAAGGDNPALRQVAAAAVPIVQAHLTEAQRIAAALR